MDFKKLNIASIEINDSVKTSKDITIKPCNYFYTPILYVPFGISEYKNSYSLNLQLRDIKNNKELNYQGMRGWELVSTYPKGHNSNTVFFVFKRELKDK